MVFLDGILILPCIDHTWFCLITNSTCTPLPSVPKIIKANTKHDLLWKLPAVRSELLFVFFFRETIHIQVLHQTVASEA